MATLIFPPPSGEAFSEYRPSKNAHVDVLSSSATGKEKEGVRVIKLCLPNAGSSSTSADLLSDVLASIQPILAGAPTARSFHYLSSACHKLVLPPHSLGPTIYTRIKEEIDTAIASLVRIWRGSIMSREANWLERLMAGWRTFHDRVGLLCAVFVYLDRIYSNETNGISSITQMATASFQKGVWNNPIILDKTREDFLAWAAAERAANAPNEELRPTIEELTDLSRELTVFESLWKPYLAAAREYYTLKAKENTDLVEKGQMPPSDYVSWVLDQAEDEMERCEECISEQMAAIPEQTVRVEAGRNMRGRVVRKALDEAMDNADLAALQRLYKFSVDTETFGDIVIALEAHIDERLRTLISDPANDPQMIEGTLKIKRFADQSIISLFSTNPESRQLAKHRGSNNHRRSHTSEQCEAIIRTGVPLVSQNGVPPKALNVGAELLARRELLPGAVRSGIARFNEFAATRNVPPPPTPKVLNEEHGDDEMDDVQEALPPVHLSGSERLRQLELEDAVRNGFKSGMGSRQNAPAEWIAKHLDTVMRRGQGAGTEAEFNALLDEIIALIGFTKDKDVFKAFYSSQLAKRLLLNKSASDDMERNMIIKLQREMGEEFTSGDVMMKDLQLSETMAKAYQTSLAKSFTSSDPTGLSANVLTESAWPTYPLLKDGWDFHLPTELQSSVSKFTDWYAIQHKNRQLSWRWQLATVTLSARFASGKYEIGVSLFQAVVLMAFNDEDVLDFTEIKKRTGIESSELVRTLQSLSLGRKGTRVLVKKPAGKDVNPTDQFGFNKSFTSDRIKFRINQIQQDMTAEESRKTNEQVAIDRVSVLEATIVRIMKAKKKMTLQLLIDAVVTDVNKRFPPDVKEIKKRMESLIEREFLMRDENDRNLLHYLA